MTQTETRIFHYDLKGHLITETNQAGQILAEYIYLGDQLLSMIKLGEGLYYFHNDHLGTPQVLTDDSGTVSWKANYTPFGQAQVVTETVTNPFRLPGQYYDVETGLHYNYFRYYCPRTGRYITPDPIGLEGGINLFSYVDNDPVNSVDPWGLARYVIMVGDPGQGRHNVGQNFVRVADTRAQELVGQGHTIDIVRVSNISQFNNAITIGSTIDGGVIYYGHGWTGVLYVGETSEAGTNIDISNISQLSNKNFGPSATIEINSCNAATGGKNSIAQQMARQLKRVTSGYDSPMGFTGTRGVYDYNRYPPSTGPLYISPTPGKRMIPFNP